jgi:signal peptidase I
MKIFKFITNFIYLIIVLTVVSLATVTAFSIFEAPGKFRAFVVTSGSMEPTLKTGSVIFVVPKETYEVGDVVTFKHELGASLKDPNSTATHRITEIHDDEGRATFTTKGDANQTPDQSNLEIARVLGRVSFSIPYLGRAVAFAKTQMGFVLLIIIPATLIIYSEILTIKKEVFKFFEKRKKSKQKDDAEEKEIKKDKKE